MAKIEGTLRNTSDVTLSFLQVNGRFFDQDGRLVGPGTGYADARELAPGSTTAFTLTGPHGVKYSVCGVTEVLAAHQQIPFTTL
jgi:hypothetical protein